jgi:hypothetical protein
VVVLAPIEALLVIAAEGEQEADENHEPHVQEPTPTLVPTSSGRDFKSGHYRKKRISQVSDDGTLSVSVAFATGETSVTLQGHATSQPMASASVGGVGAVTWNAGTGMFTVPVSSAGGVAAITLH